MVQTCNTVQGAVHFIFIKLCHYFVLCIWCWYCALWNISLSLLTGQDGGLDMLHICACVKLECPPIFWQRATTVTLSWFVGCTCENTISSIPDYWSCVIFYSCMCNLQMWQVATLCILAGCGLDIPGVNYSVSLLFCTTLHFVMKLNADFLHSLLCDICSE